MSSRIVTRQDGTRRVVELSRSGRVKADWPACDSCEGTGTSGPVFTREDGATEPLVPGCALDGAMGWHNTYRVVREIASPLGYELSPEDDAILTAYESGTESVVLPNGQQVAQVDIGQLSSEIADEATDWLNEHTTRGYWQWDMGELHLMPSCDEDESEPCTLADPDECATHGLMAY